MLILVITFIASWFYIAGSRGYSIDLYCTDALVEKLGGSSTRSQKSLPGMLDYMADARQRLGKASQATATGSGP